MLISGDDHHDNKANLITSRCRQINSTHVDQSAENNTEFQYFPDLARKLQIQG